MTIRIRRPIALARKLTAGSGGLGAAYADGDWDTDDLVASLRRLARMLRPAQWLLDGAAPLVTGLDDRRRPSTSAERDRAQIRAHYDLSDELFALFLDPTMAYSSAVFPHGQATLEEAQLAKFQRLCDLVALGPDDHVLEIGAGWGGLAAHAAATTGCRVTTTTISANQHTAATTRAAANGLADRVTVLDADWRELTGRYDAILSVEMVEAVDWRDLDAFFAGCSRLLRPGGRAALQTIVIDDRAYDRYKRSDGEFIRSTIFPGGCVHSVRALRAAAQRAGFTVARTDDLTPHYVETLRRWRVRFDDEEQAVRALGFDERFVRLWRFYLDYCAAGFLEGRVGLVQLVLVRPDARVPTVAAGVRTTPGWATWGAEGADDD